MMVFMQDWEKDDKRLQKNFVKLTGYDYYDAAPFVLEGGSIHSGRGGNGAGNGSMSSK